jgi:ubiquitin-conjugating enzyme E2 Q
MSVRRFRADVGSATAKVQLGEIPGVTGIGRGDSNGEVVITYRHADLPNPIRLRALAQDASEYPDGNNFMLFTDSDDAPPEVMSAMEHVQEYLLGITVTEMVMEVANAITSALNANTSHGGGQDDEDEAMTDYDDTLSCDGDSEGEDNDFIGNDDEYFGLATSQDTYQQPLSSGKVQSGLSPLDQEVLQRIKSDLLVAKQAGFRVGVLNGLGVSDVSGIVCVSIRVNKLDLSEEALMAWDVPDNDYVVLLIKHDSRYFPLEKIVELPAAHSGVQLRIGLCKTYKPAASEAIKAFSNLDSAPEPIGSQGNPDDAFRSMFISASLNQFMNESLISIIKLRLSRGASWDYANELLLLNSSLGVDGSAVLDYDSLQSENSDEGFAAAGGIPNRILLSDHLLEAGQARSFPLIAMQFAMRYFARCTQYCLRCHRQVEEGFEALRPYVCSNPLCLFQYMTMGLGPNVEHEILTEPSVVDLLVSLCYASLQATSRYQTPMMMSSAVSAVNTPATTFPIREFPVGLRLRVPNLFDPQPDRPLPITVKLDRRNTALVYSDDAALKRLHANQWIVLRYRAPDKTSGSQPNLPDLQSYAWTHSARITGIFLDQGRVEIALMGRSDTPGALANAFPANVQKADIYTYDVDFDTLTDAEKSIAMQHVLNTLPPIEKIREYLSNHPNATLRSYEKVSSAAATLLIWIVSSNRSCINEIGTLETADPQHDQQKVSQIPCWTVKDKRKKEYIPGMNGYIQFRFSQGSPDKELRFNKALQGIAGQKDLSQYPTIFAWHGSNVANWHSILRTGLDFKEIAYGRAFGNGVYFSPLFATSISYAMAAATARWPNSALDVQSILSLNEIINAPERFVSRNPHYVVQEQDWHQCRYLFVSSSVRQGAASLSTRVADDGNQVTMLRQAPGCEVKGPTGQALSIPVASMPTRSANPALGAPVVTSRKPARVVEEDSDESSAEDQELLALDGNGRRMKLSRSSSVETIFARDT